MSNSKFKNAPPLYGWAIAVAAGALMFGVSLLVLDIGGNGSVAIGVVVALIVGLIFTLAESKPASGATRAASSPAPSASAPSAASVPPASTATTSAENTAAPAAPASTETAAATASSTSAVKASEPATGAAAASQPAAATDTGAKTTDAPAAAQDTPPAAEVEPEKPKGLDGPVGAADDLKRISGVGPVLEGKLNALGCYHFWQIAKWSRAEVEWVDGYLSFKGRIDRDDWISQARKLAEDSPSKPPA